MASPRLNRARATRDGGVSIPGPNDLRLLYDSLTIAGEHSMTKLNGWIRNRVTEKDLRDYLTDRGFDGRGARITDLELAAIARPGWIQIFRFEVRTQDKNSNWYDFFGVVRDDERYQMQVLLTTVEEEREERFQEWSEGLFKAERQPLSMAQKYLLVLFLAFMALAIVSAWF